MNVILCYNITVIDSKKLVLGGSYNERYYSNNI